MTSPSPSTETHGLPVGRVAVVGSANIDTTVHVHASPKPGETVEALTWASDIGGKGVNQVVAAARAGADAVFIGGVGDDEAGATVARTLEREGIDIRGLARGVAPTGAAFITVTPDGENTVVLMAGANSEWRVTDEVLGFGIERADLVVTQAEVPARVQRQIARVARMQRKPVMFTAAPVAAVATDVLPSVTFLFVNEEEALQLSGLNSFDEAISALSSRVMEHGYCVGTRGGREILAATGGRIALRVAPPRVESPTDTTAAGDTFAGWCAARLAEGATMEEAIREASLAAALSVTRAGATSSIPRRGEIG